MALKKVASLVSGLLVLLIALSPATSFAYTNVYGSKVSSPVHSQVIPIGASAKCKDSTFSFSASRRGTCSHHGGVKTWFK
jgi:hypothetical protein